MRLSADPRSILGMFAVIAMVALSSPGVRAVHAEETRQSDARAERRGPTCEPASPETSAADAQAILDAIRMRAALEPEDPTGDVVVLNNRGFNYAPTPGLVGAPTPGADPLR